MNVYVATKWENRDEAARVMKDLQDLGHVITCDWTTVDQESQAQAAADMAGVLFAEAVIVLAEQDWPFKGTYVEMGMALAAGTQVYIVGPYANTIFDKLPTVRRFPDYKTFIQWFSA